MWSSGSYEHICLRGCRFESHWNEILREGGNEKDSAECRERVVGMTEHRMTAGNGNELCGEGGMRMTEHGMTAYPLLS
jgi:hypothetical protein